MPLVRKEVIEPGVYWYEDRDTGLPRKLTVTPEKVQHYFDTGKKMLASGLSIPVPIEHQPDARPLSAADRAANRLKNNGGFVKDFDLANGKLFSTLDIIDDTLAKKLPSVKWTSPWITSFFDGNGNNWEEVIGHVALTTRPRITKQTPFPDIQAAMNYVGQLDEVRLSAEVLKEPGICLSLAGLLRKDDKGALRPRAPRAFSLWSGARLSVEDLADKKKGDVPPKEKAGEGEAPRENKSGDPLPKGKEGEEGEEGYNEIDEDISICDVIADLMEVIMPGFHMPEGCTEDNFEKCLYSGLMERMKGGPTEPDDLMNDPNTANPGAANNPAPGKAPVVAEAPPLYMSMDKVREKAKAIADPAVRELLEAAFSLGDGNQKRAEQLQKAAFTGAREKREARMAALVRRNPAIKDQLAAQAVNATFSLGDDGSIVDSLTPVLDILEAGIKAVPTLLTASSAALAVVPHPKDPEGPNEMPEERRQAVVDEFCKNAHIKPLPQPKAG